MYQQSQLKLKKSVLRQWAWQQIGAVEKNIYFLSVRKDGESLPFAINKSYFYKAPTPALTSLQNN